MDNAAILKFKIEIPFGMFNLAEEEIGSAFNDAEP